MQLSPLGDRILVKRLETAEAPKGTIIIPEKHRDKPQEGTVLEVGKGRLLMSGAWAPSQCRVGDRVMFGKFTGVEVVIGEETVLILREDDILGILR